MFLFVYLGSEPSAPKWKEKAKEQIPGMFCLACCTLSPLRLWEGRVGGYLEAPTLRT